MGIWGFSDGNSIGQEQSEPHGKEGSFPVSDLKNVDSKLSITVVGASGDLAKKKIFPALFALYYEDCLPEVLALISCIKFYFVMVIIKIFAHDIMFVCSCRIL